MRNILYVNTSRSLLASRVVQLELACPPRRDNDDADSSDSRFPLHFLSDLMMAPTTAPRPSSIDASLPPNGHSAKSFFSAWLHPQSPTGATSRVFISPWVTFYKCPIFKQPCLTFVWTKLRKRALVQSRDNFSALDLDPMLSSLSLSTFLTLCA